MSSTESQLSTTLGGPLILKCVRCRLRPQELAMWIGLTVVTTGFAFLLVFLVARARGRLDTELAAKFTLIPLIAIQGVLLMLMGTGSVASGLANEKDAGVLDYHRLSPMPVTSKILGYLIGLPIREYVLFVATLPFLAYAVIAGNVGISLLLQFYAVFFTSVWLYHMTGLVAGIVSPKARRAGLIAQALVLMLYFVMPRLSDFGFKFFSYLTVRPTGEMLLLEEMREISAMSGSRLDQFEMARLAEDASSVGFFHLEVHPTAFTLLVQAFALVSLFLVVHRKWRDPRKHAFSKGYAVIFFAVIQFMLIGSSWPILTQEKAFNDFVNRIGYFFGDQLSTTLSLAMMLMTFLYVTGAMAVGLIHTITASSYQYSAGLRRMKRLDLPRVPHGSDAAANLRHGLVMIALGLLGYGILLGFAWKRGVFFDYEPGIVRMLAPALLFATTVFYVACAHEYLGTRGFLVLLFTVWAVPVMLFLLIVAPYDASIVPAAYVSAPSPVTTCAFSVIHMFQNDWEYRELGVLRPHLPMVLTWSLAVNLTLCVVFFILMRQKHQRLRESALAAPQDDASPSKLALIA